MKRRSSFELTTVGKSLLPLATNQVIILKKNSKRCMKASWSCDPDIPIYSFHVDKISQYGNDLNGLKCIQ